MHVFLVERVGAHELGDGMHLLSLSCHLLLEFPLFLSLLAVVERIVSVDL